MRRLSLLIPLAIFLAAPGAAEATTYCSGGAPGCTGTTVVPADLETAALNGDARKDGQPDTVILGAGNPLQLAATAFLGTLLVLSVGGVLAAAWVRFGALGPTVVSAAAVVALGLVAILLVPVLGAFQVWWLALAAVLVIAISVTGQYAFLRRASVR